MSQLVHVVSILTCYFILSSFSHGECYHCSNCRYASHLLQALECTHFCNFNINDAFEFRSQMSIVVYQYCVLTNIHYNIILIFVWPK